MDNPLVQLAVLVVLLLTPWGRAILRTTVSLIVWVLRELMVAGR